MRALGATVAVDYSTSDWQRRVREALGERQITATLDGVGGELGRGARGLTGVGGRIILFGWSSGEPMPVTAEDITSGGLTVSASVGPRMLRRPGGLRELEDRALAALASGELVPLVGQTFPLSGAAQAHRALQGRNTTGKVVLTP